MMNDKIKKKCVGLLPQFKSPVKGYVLLKGKKVITKPITLSTANRLLRSKK